MIPKSMTIQTEKVSVSLPAALLEFVENHKATHQCRSRSQVVEQALELLRMQELEVAYREASQEVETVWDVTISDGLSDEAG